jgi:hypothetical protein
MGYTSIEHLFANCITKLQILVCKQSPTCCGHPSLSHPLGFQVYFIDERDSPPPIFVARWLALAMPILPLSYIVMDV